MENEKVLERLKEETEKKIGEVMQQGIQANNVDMLYSLVDIHKDIANEEYWKEKEEHMKYRTYGEGAYNERGRGSYNDGSYGARGRGRERDSRGRYMEGSRGGRYRGHDMIDEMYDGYSEYSEGKSRYGAGPETMEPLEAMLESVVDFMEMLKRDAGSQEETELIRHYAKKISEM